MKTKRELKSYQLDTAILSEKSISGLLSKLEGYFYRLLSDSNIDFTKVTYASIDSEENFDGYVHPFLYITHERDLTEREIEQERKKKERQKLANKKAAEKRKLKKEQEILREKELLKELLEKYGN